MAFNIVLTEVNSPFAQALLRELEHHTFSVLVPNANDNELTSTTAGVVVDSRAYAGEAWLPVQGMAALPVIHISSNEVFSGPVPGAGFSEQDTPNAITPRARALIDAETGALAGNKTLVLRLPLLLDVGLGDWFGNLLEQLSTQPVLSVSETTRLDPVCIKEACRVVIAMVQQISCGAENWGVMHLRSAETCFEAEFADHLVRQLKKENWPAAQLDVTKGQSLWSNGEGALAGRRVTDVFGVQMRSWRLGVKSLLQRWIDERRQLELALPAASSVGADAELAAQASKFTP